MQIGSASYWCKQQCYMGGQQALQQLQCAGSCGLQSIAALSLQHNTTQQRSPGHLQTLIKKRGLWAWHESRSARQ